MPVFNWEFALDHDPALHDGNGRVLETMQNYTKTIIRRQPRRKAIRNVYKSTSDAYGLFVTTIARIDFVIKTVELSCMLAEIYHKTVFVPHDIKHNSTLATQNEQVTR